MNSQETIEQNVRLMLGDLMLQTVILKARITELENELAAKESEAPPEPEAKINGKQKAETRP